MDERKRNAVNQALLGGVVTECQAVKAQGLRQCNICINGVKSYYYRCHTNL